MDDIADRICLLGVITSVIIAATTPLITQAMISTEIKRHDDLRKMTRLYDHHNCRGRLMAWILLALLVSVGCFVGAWFLGNVWSYPLIALGTFIGAAVPVSRSCWARRRLSQQLGRAPEQDRKDHLEHDL